MSTFIVILKISKTAPKIHRNAYKFVDQPTPSISNLAWLSTNCNTSGYLSLDILKSSFLKKSVLDLIDYSLPSLFYSFPSDDCRLSVRKKGNYIFTQKNAISDAPEVHLHMHPNPSDIQSLAWCHSEVVHVMSK